MSFPKFDNPELLNDFQNILNTLEKIKSVEEMSLSGGDFKRSKLDVRSELRTSEIRHEKNSSSCELYCYVLQILQVVIGWILRYSTKILSTICDCIGRIIAESFLVISEDFQYFYNPSQDGRTICFEIIKNFTINKALHLAIIILLPPVFAIVKVLVIFNKFLLSEIPFE